MFGIGLPEMIVIMAVALIVVGPDKLPELARSLAKGIGELKQTLNQVKENLSEESKVISSVQEDLKKSTDQLTENLLEGDSDTWHPEDRPSTGQDDEEVDVIDLQPLAERPWEKDANQEPESEKKGPEEEQQQNAPAPDSHTPEDASAVAGTKDTPPPAA